MIELNLQYKYLWIYKFLIQWSMGISIEYYPDYETPSWEWQIK